ncbi:MAG TPA: alginate export family protein [candidate division Zixibacteria bacterium]|nr:alginate export family protein [candidate division Zixibacteria bacterium]
MTYHTGKGATGWLPLATFMLLLCVFQANAFAGDGKPEYMKLKYETGLTLEIEGVWDSSGALIAEDIEKLPQPRSPKLRGAIQAVDRDKRTFTMYGQTIEFTEDTWIVEADSTASSGDLFERIQAGNIVEVSCKVNEENEWKARKIKTQDVKPSLKVKGSLTEVRVDGNPPDTIFIHTLKIILTPKTDINEPRSDLKDIEYEKFRAASYGSAHEADDGIELGERALLTGKYRASLANETEYDLSKSRQDKLSETEPGLKAELTGFLGESVRTQAQLRLRKRVLLSNDRTPQPSDDFEAHITQLFLLARDVGARGLAVQIGRQDFDEPREWLFDDYLDAIRVHYYQPQGFFGEAALILSIHPIKEKFDTWTDLFLQGGWRLDKDNAISAYVLRRRDSDLRNREPVWWGARYIGAPHPDIRGWCDIALMRGEDKGRTLRAWAVDLGGVYTFSRSPLTPTITLSYAVGSGDKTGGDGEDNNFRQTDYEDNVARLGGGATVSYYGELFDPELSNMKILTLAAAIYPWPEWSVEALYHTYRQRELDNDLAGSDLLDPTGLPNGASDELGWEVDFVAGSPKIGDRVRLKWTLAIFSPGAAFAPFIETAVLNRVNVDVPF